MGGSINRLIIYWGEDDGSIIRPGDRRLFVNDIWHGPRDHHVPGLVILISLLVNHEELCLVWNGFDPLDNLFVLHTDK